MPSRATAAFVILLLAGSPQAVLAQTPEAPQDSQRDLHPTLVLRAFGALQWTTTDRPEVPTQFSLGQFVFFATSNLGERVSVLAEIVLEAGTETRVVTDLERLQLTFRANDYLHLSAGRYHTGIGYYNTAFHHGDYFAVPIGRPRVFGFEDEGGVLPIHDVGITVRGAVPRTGQSLYYLAEVGNGSPSANPGHAHAGAMDTYGARATNVGLSWRPDQWRGLEIGASFYRDHIRPDGRPSLNQRIAAAFIVYRTASVEMMAEWLNIAHKDDAEPWFGNHAGYAQVSRAWGQVRPYYRYDRLAIDPLTPGIGVVGSVTGHTIGIRLDPAQWVGVKAQYERSDESAHRRVDTVRAQLVFVF